MFDSLVFDISMRVPQKKIVLRGDTYFADAYKLSSKTVQKLIEEKYVEKNRNGGLIVLPKAYDHSETLVGKKKIESKKQPGHFFDCGVFPEEFLGEIDGTI